MLSRADLSTIGYGEVRPVAAGVGVVVPSAFNALPRQARLHLIGSCRVGVREHALPGDARRVATFAPWATSDVAGLFGEFYASPGAALPADRRQQVQGACLHGVRRRPGSEGGPFVGAVAEATSRAGHALEVPPPWQIAFAEASRRLSELRQPILVVEDIDGLPLDELIALLKVVWPLGRSDGVRYLLAYDDETLYRSMTAFSAITAHDEPAERFMEIVQYPLVVPPLLPAPTEVTESKITQRICHSS